MLYKCVVFADIAIFSENNLFFSEPGYYEDGEFGIRIENLVHVTGAKTKVNILFPDFLLLLLHPYIYIFSIGHWRHCFTPYSVWSEEVSQ